MESVKIEAFLSSGDGDGSGSGYDYSSGYGSGYGYGYGDGDGYGDGYGSGYGSGDGYGSGYGSGDGDGSGYGSGSGSGDGYGSGYGDGYGVKSIDGASVHRIDGVPTIISGVHGNVAKGCILQSDLTLTPCFVVKHDNLFAHGDTLAAAQKALEDKVFESLDTDDKIQAFCNEFARGVKHPARKFYDWHHRLTGSCEMGRAVFARDHGIDVDTAEYTVDEFIALTESAYGGEIIRQLKAAWETTK